MKWRLSLRECDSSSRSSRIRTPTEGTGQNSREWTRMQTNKDLCSFVFIRLNKSFGSDALGGERFDDVAGFDVVVVRERNAAFEAGFHFARVVLEALQTNH